MKCDPMPWLPVPSIGEQEAAICKVMTRWSATWMSTVPTLRCATTPRSAVGAVQWHGSPAARVGVKDKTEIALGYAACAGRAERANPRDRELMSRIGKDMVRNLGAFLEDAIGTGLTDTTDGLLDICFRVSVQDDTWALILAVRADALVRLRQAAAGCQRQRAFGKMADALEDIPVTLGCHLGEAILTTAQASSLTMGDLVVLDRTLDAELPLLVAHDQAAAGSARVGTDNGKISMTIVNPGTCLQKAHQSDVRH